jgi:glycosyltransferase involved in cell wall biosynthesis
MLDRLRRYHAKHGRDAPAALNTGMHLGHRILHPMQPSRSANPMVTVVMPTYNHEAFIEHAIDSVLAQTFADWELVVVDDGSSDDTARLILGYSDPRISLIARDHQGLAGLGDAYAAALNASSAPLLAILEGDDRWPPDKLARQVGDFEDRTVVLSYGEGGLMDELGCVYGRVIPSFPRAVRTNRPTGSILPALLSGNPILSPTVVVRRSAIDAIGGFWQPEGVRFVDHPTWLLLARLGGFAYHDAIVGYWRRHSAQWTTSAARRENGSIPEKSYIPGLVERFGAADGSRPDASSWEALSRSHTERAILNRWRLALLSGSRADLLSGAWELLVSGRPRLIALAAFGVAAWSVGSDLEWLQLRRNRVAWPPRRHRHGVPGTSPSRLG